MKMKSIQITSSSTLDFESIMEKQICVFRGSHSGLALDLIRELIGDYGAKHDPDRIDDGHFVIHADIELDGKHYAVCYIRNADFMGDHRIAANFAPNSIAYSQDDTALFVDTCNERDKDSSNVIDDMTNTCHAEDDRPVFLYASQETGECELLDFLDTLSHSRRQIFVAVPLDFPALCCPNMQDVTLE